MGSFVLSDAFISINGVDLSDQVESVEITHARALKEFTTMGKAGIVRKAGLYDWSARITFFQNFDAAKVDATLFPLVGVQTALRIRSVNGAAISATNPEYQGNGMMAEYPILGGETVGEPGKASGVTFVMSDGVALVRDTTP
jgi:hypothetical protein